jgi:hypothetical protein
MLRLSSFVLCLALTLPLVLQVASSPAMAAEPRSIIGDWEGTLDPGAQSKKRIVVHISADQDGTLNGTIDYPDEETSGMMITAITYKEHVLHFESSANLSAYDGTMSGDKSQITGKWTQQGRSVDLVLKRTP